jgi:hypothetical protein
VAVARIRNRKNPTWRDCVEIAEACLHFRNRRSGSHDYDRDDPMCALVFAVLRAGGVDEVFLPEVGRLSIIDGPDGPCASVARWQEA